MNTSSLASLAALMGLIPSDAVALPAVVTKVSQMFGLSESELVWRCHNQAALRAEIAATCRRTMKLAEAA